MDNKKYIKIGRKKIYLKYVGGNINNSSYDKCNEAIDDYLFSQIPGNEESIEQNCGYKITEKQKQTTDNIFNPSDTECVLVTKRCDASYYKYKYEYPLNNSDEYHIYNDNIDTTGMFCTDTLENCCNCISITLYTTKCNNDIVTYLSSIARTVKNVKIGLPGWIVRIYMDISVYSYIKNNITDCEDSKSLSNKSMKKNIAYIKKINDYVQFLENAENVEIFTYICKYENYERLRIQRFLPLLERDTNIVVIREADGFVTFQDCHNIKVFSDSKLLFFTIPLFETSMKYVDYSNCSISSYSNWYSIYKHFIQKEYFSKKWNTFDILAGCIATKLKLDKQFLINKIKFIHDSINNLIKEIDMNYITINDINKHSTRATYKTLGEISKTLNLGFDEILLLDIFKDFISVKYEETINNDKSYYDNRIYVKLTKYDKLTERILSDTFIRYEDPVIHIENDHFNGTIHNYINTIIINKYINQSNYTDKSYDVIEQIIDNYDYANMKNNNYLFILIKYCFDSIRTETLFLSNKQRVSLGNTLYNILIDMYIFNKLKYSDSFLNVECFDTNINSNFSFTESNKLYSYANIPFVDKKTYKYEKYLDFVYGLFDNL